MRGADSRTCLLASPTVQSFSNAGLHSVSLSLGHHPLLETLKRPENPHDVGSSPGMGGEKGVVDCVGIEHEKTGYVKNHAGSRTDLAFRYAANRDAHAI